MIGIDSKELFRVRKTCGVLRLVLVKVLLGCLFRWVRSNLSPDCHSYAAAFANRAAGNLPLLLLPSQQPSFIHLLPNSSLMHEFPPFLSPTRQHFHNQPSSKPPLATTPSLGGREGREPHHQEIITYIPKSFTPSQYFPHYSSHYYFYSPSSPSSPPASHSHDYHLHVQISTNPNSISDSLLYRPDRANLLHQQQQQQ